MNPIFKHPPQKLFPLFIIVIIGITTIIYYKILGHQFTNWDDGLYVIHNPYLKSLSWDYIKAMFSSFLAGNYHPLTLLSLALNYSIAQMEPWIYFLTNLILHVCNIYLVFRMVYVLLNNSANLKDKAVYIALMCALLFGIHAFQVESVAWVSERKNVLYVFFFLFSLHFYIRYIIQGKRIWYLFALVLFIFSLLSKGTAVTLSVCLLCIDFYYSRPLKSRLVILEKIPFFILSLLFGIIAIYAQHSSEAFRESESFNFLERIAVASYGLVQYLVKTIYPYNLSTYYPYPAKPGEWLPLLFYVSIVIIPVLIFITWKFYKSHRIYLFGILFFLINISLVSQIIPVGDAIMADRYMYLPSIGLFWIFSVWMYSIHFKRRIFLHFARVGLVLYVSILVYKTNKQAGIWENSLTLWEDAIQKYPEYNDRAYLNRGNAFYEMGDYFKAEADYQRVLAIDFKNSGALIGMGLIKKAGNNLTESLDYFDKAVTYHQTYEGYTNRAALKISLLDYSGALADLDEAYRLDPYRTGVYNNRGYIYLNTGRYSEAMDNFNQALNFEPNSYNAFLGIARVKQAIGELDVALVYINKALGLKQTYEAFTVSSDIKFMMRDIEGARGDLDKAMSINPLKADAYLNRGILELEVKNEDLAFAYYNKAIELEPKNAQAYLYRGIAKIDVGNLKSAVCDLDTSLLLLDNPTSYYYRAIAFSRMGMDSEACKDYKLSAEMGNVQASEEFKKLCGNKKGL